jgi:hypothetical protein
MDGIIAQLSHRQSPEEQAYSNDRGALKRLAPGCEPPTTFRCSKRLEILVWIWLDV